MVPRHTGHVGCSSPASGVLDEKGIIGVSPGASGYRRIGMLVRVCSQRKRVLLCGKSLRQRNIGAPGGPLTTAIMASNNDSRHIDPAVSRGGVMARFKTKRPTPGTQTSFLPARGDRPETGTGRSWKIAIKVEIV